MIKEDYVSFETARLLKEKRFNEPCRLYYDKYHGYVPIFVEDSKLTEYGYKELVRNDQDSISDFIASAPSLYVAMKWLREMHNIHIELNPICTGDSNEDLEWHYGWAVRTTIFTDRWKRHDAEHISYEQACEAAIKYCLENLI